MRVQTSIGVTVSEPSQATYFQRDAQSSGAFTDAFDSASTDTFVLADTTLPLTVTLGNLQDARGLYLEADGPVSVTINGASAPLRLQPADDATQTRFFVETPISLLRLAAGTPGVAVRGRYVVWGNSAPPP